MGKAACPFLHNKQLDSLLPPLACTSSSRGLHQSRGRASPVLYRCQLGLKCPGQKWSYRTNQNPPQMCLPCGPCRFSTIVRTNCNDLQIHLRHLCFSWNLNCARESDNAQPYQLLWATCDQNREIFCAKFLIRISTEASLFLAVLCPSGPYHEPSIPFVYLNVGGPVTTASSVVGTNLSRYLCIHHWNNRRANIFWKLRTRQSTFVQTAEAWEIFLDQSNIRAHRSCSN